MSGPIEQPERIKGWDAIAAVCEVDRRTAFRWAHEPVDRLPVFSGPSGVWAFATALRDWLLRRSFTPLDARYVGGDEPTRTRANRSRLAASRQRL